MACSPVFVAQVHALGSWMHREHNSAEIVILLSVIYNKTALFLQIVLSSPLHILY